MTCPRYTPPGYAPCTRDTDHDGPCAHERKPIAYAGDSPAVQGYFADLEAERRAAKAAQAVREKIARDGEACKRREHEIGRKAWRQTYTGRQVFPLDPRPGDFAIEDIAHGLSNLSRYGGQARRFYSVAEHSVLCSLFGDPAYARRRLMHDAAEAVFGFDLASPLKRHPAFSWFRALEEAAEAAIFAQFDCDAPGDWKEIDTRILLDERPALFGPPPADWRVPGEPLGACISGFRPEVAKDLFLARFQELFPEYQGP